MQKTAKAVDTLSNQTLAAQPTKNSDRQNKNRASNGSPLTRRSVKQRSVGSTHEKMSSTAAAGILGIENIANFSDSAKEAIAVLGEFYVSVDKRKPVLGFGKTITASNLEGSLIAQNVLKREGSSGSVYRYDDGHALRISNHSANANNFMGDGEHLSIEQERKKEVQKNKAHIAEIQQNKQLRAEQTELRHKVRKVIRDLDKILRRGNKQRNVKEDMKGFVSKALELADDLFTDHISNDDLIMSGIDADLMRGDEAELVRETEKIIQQIQDNYGTITEEEYKRLTARKKRNMEALRELLTKQRNRRLKTPVYNLFDDLVTEYAKLKNSDQDSAKAAYNPEVERFLRSYMGDTMDGADSDKKTILQNMRVADIYEWEHQRQIDKAKKVKILQSQYREGL